MDNAKPPEIGNVWSHSCSIQKIFGNKWKTVSLCLWTPNKIKEALAKLPKGSYWVKDPSGIRTPQF